MSGFGGGFGGGGMGGLKGGGRGGAPKGGGNLEEAHERPLDRELIKRLYQLTIPYARLRNALFVLTIIRSIQLPLIAYGVSIILYGPILGNDFPKTLTWTAGLFALMAFTMLIFHFRQRYALELGENVVHDLRNQIFEHLQKLSMDYYDKTKLGSIISRMVSDAETIRLGVQDVVFVGCVQGGQMIVAAIIMAWLDWVLFLVLAVMAPLLYWVTQYFRKRLGEAYRTVQESFSRVTAALAESVNGIRVTQGFVRQEENASRFRNLIDRHADLNVAAGRLQGVFLPLLELNSQFFIAVLLALGGFQVLRGGMFGAGTPEEQQAQFAAVGTFILIAPQFFGPIATIGRLYNQALSAMAGAERVFRLLDRDPEKLDDADAIDLPPITGRVVFDKVQFAYNPQTQVLFDIDFVAEPGQTIALVGHTGSGKSTIIKLISKFYLPTGGHLRIDGHDIRKVTSNSLIRQLGIVLQSNFLFTGTVMDNIKVGKADATDQQVIDAARKLNCLDLLETLPDGLHTPVGESGGSLSLGQRQLVCFTRAMLADPRILILDEATSSVDTMTEARIQEALAILLKNRTSFVVAHRLSTIRHADQVLVLDRGRIIERGTHNHLLTRQGTYAGLYRQFIKAAEA